MYSQVTEAEKKAHFKDRSFLAWAAFLVRFARSADMARHTVIVLEDCVIMEAVERITVPEKRFLFRLTKYNASGIFLTAVFKCPESICSMLAHHRCTAKTKHAEYTTWEPELVKAFADIPPLDSGLMTTPTITISVHLRLFSSSDALPTAYLQNSDVFNPVLDMASYGMTVPRGIEWISLRANYSLALTLQHYILDVGKFQYHYKPLMMPESIFCHPTSGSA